MYIPGFGLRFGQQSRLGKHPLESREPPVSERGITIEVDVLAGFLPQSLKKRVEKRVNGIVFKGKQWLVPNGNERRTISHANVE